MKLWGRSGILVLCGEGWGGADGKFMLCKRKFWASGIMAPFGLPLVRSGLRKAL